ncbi:integrase core domain-containing protein [Photobacterium sagamiensis]|uniref:integrase core domain-containing protein n=1 Tax=Photobacterium sagamiensis TaxID=2910241 RepID=UPI003D13EB05
MSWESTFRTLKYRPNWPSHGFKDLAEVRDWVQAFVEWYNNDHKHSRIKFVTPSQRHDGIDREILVKRKEVLRLAKAKNPLRWSREIQDCNPIGPVTLNPENRMRKAA